MISNKIRDEITKVWRTSPQNSSETVTNEGEIIGIDREIPKGRYLSSEKQQNIIYDLRLTNT